MKMFAPDFQIDRVTAIDIAFLKKNQIEALILDVDNTLTTHGNPEPGEGVVEWIDSMHEAGIPMMIVSNNSKARVAPFAKRLGLPFVSRGWKPLTVGITKACASFGLPPERVAMVGDQLLTDILGGNWKGMKTILTKPIQLEDGPFFRLKRRIEGKLMD